MPKWWQSIVFGGLFVCLNGCGGSSFSTGSGGAVGGVAFSQYQATLPDGSPMELEVIANNGTVWAGEYAVAAETGSYAYQAGSFYGSVLGNSVNADCENSDGTSFQLSGTANGNASLKLTRSDIPGTVLNFTPVVPSGRTAQATTSFNMDTGLMSGRVLLSTTPYSSTSTLVEYRGTWNQAPTTFFAYKTGYAILEVFFDDIGFNTLTFNSYRLSDFPTVTQNSKTAVIYFYSKSLKNYVKFKGVASVSP